MTIYLIAGPPGIGKSTNARALVPAAVPIIDQDLAAYQYKKQGFTTYQDIASVSTQQRIRTSLFADEDFALELNLGFVSHYDYLKSIAAFNPANQIQLLLFFTDDLNLCLNRAAVRYQNGGHEVKAETVAEMYQQTIPLFLKHQALFSRVRLINVTSTATIELVQPVELNRGAARSVEVGQAASLPDWVIRNGLQQYLSVDKPTNTKRPNLRRPKF